MKNACRILKNIKIDPKYFYIYNLISPPLYMKNACLLGEKKKTGKKSIRKKLGYYPIIHGEGTHHQQAYA